MLGCSESGGEVNAGSFVDSEEESVVAGFDVLEPVAVSSGVAAPVSDGFGFGLASLSDEAVEAAVMDLDKVLSTKLLKPS